MEKELISFMNGLSSSYKFVASHYLYEVDYC